MSDPFSRPPTMADIARRVGLGRSTVSMALRNHPEIAAATRDRVLKAATELGYKPNPLISLLMSRLHQESAARRDTVIAVLSEPEANWSWRDFPFFQRLWAGLEGQALRRGYLIEEFVVGSRGLQPARLAQVLRARGIPGVIVAPKPERGPSGFADWTEFACVTINWSISQPELPRACIDFFRNFNRAWDALQARGYRRIGFMNNPGISERLEHQYQAANLARQDQLAPADRVSTLALPVPLLGAEAVREWLGRERPDAVLVADGGLMVPLLLQVAKVPGELGVAALELASAPAGTAGIDERITEIGAATVDMLIGRLQRNERGLPEVPRILHVSGAWRDGDTVRSAVVGR